VFYVYVLRSVNHSPSRKNGAMGELARPREYCVGLRRRVPAVAPNVAATKSANL
jgi:hypothetical protein